MTVDELHGWLARQPHVLDGAMGSELLRRGVTAAARLWGVGALLEDPAAVRAVHRDHLAAGAEVLTAATFRVAPYALRRHGLEGRAEELALTAVRLAREAAADVRPQALVLAAMTTLEDCYRPDLVPSDDTLLREHRATAALLAAAHPDAILLETLNTVRELEAATRAAAATGLAVLACVTCVSDGRLLSGEDAAEAARAAERAGAAAVGVNCTRVDDVAPALARLASVTRLPLIAYANDAYFAEDSRFLAAAARGPQAYARCARAWVAAGARLVGGCCGTTPAHIEAVATTLPAAQG